jgi:two-component system CheB/CheR fusion protein
VGGIVPAQKKKKDIKGAKNIGKKGGAQKKTNKKRSGRKSVATSKKPVQKISSEGSFPIIGIGASAGGLEALEVLISHVPSGSNIAMVIIQHMAPTHKSIMDTLLRKHTDMNISQAKDGMKIEPNSIYLNPSDKHVAVMGGAIVLIDFDEAQVARHQIDFFFRTLAEDQGEKAICIVLSGTGTDGTLGLKAVKGEGGMTMAQEVSQAKYDSMPRSAISTGLVDFVLPVEKMGSVIKEYVKHPYIDKIETTQVAEQKFLNVLSKIFLVIRSVTGHDFSNYKQNTIRRRLERRMAINQIETIEDYYRYIQKNPDEVENLDKDLLIGVTNFFRDKKAFEILEEKVMPSLFENKLPDSSLRIWIPGCASGEEAYSMAIIFDELMERLQQHFSVQIFATDIDSDSIDNARTGVYPESISADVSHMRLKRYFIKEDSNYRIKKKIREMVVFAVHDLVKDPPFSRMDMISCRNVLIYMDQVLQKKILPIFHYSLKQGGILFFGTSESVGKYADLFSPVDSKWKIFRRKGGAADKEVEFPAIANYVSGAELPRSKYNRVVTEKDIRHIGEKVILENYVPSSVLINEKYDILYFFGKTDRFLFPPAGEPSFNILKMVHEELRYKMSSALNKAVKQQKTVVSRGLKIMDDNNYINVDLVIKPLKEMSGLDGLMMVVFEEKNSSEKEAQSKKKPVVAKKGDQRVAVLEQELKSTREYLQTTIEELETSNEELKSTNEELQSTNEELQSSNEELETSKEEMQSTNEELESVNSELQSKIIELSRANDDLNNLLSVTEIGTIFLDNDFRIKRFTSAVTKIFNLIQTDIDRPVSDITSRLIHEDIHKYAEEVLDTLIAKEMELKTMDGSWFQIRILPYRTLENVIDGVVITFTDVTRIKEFEIAAEEAQLLAWNIVDTVREPLVVLDRDLRIMSANNSFYRTFEVPKEETENILIYDLGNRQWNIPVLRTLLEDILNENSTVEGYEVQHDFPRIGQKTMLLNARRIHSKDKGNEMILLAIADITDKKRGNDEAKKT